MAYIEIKNLNYWYPKTDKESLKNVNLNLEKGEILLISGKSGSGKSTLAKAICGSVPNFYGGTIGGEILINGTNIGKISHSKRASEITMVFQDPERQLMMDKVHREIAFGLENIGAAEKQIKRRVFEALEFSNIMELAFRDIKTLSGGQKQRVAITSAIAYLPKCIILDEPTSQLDPASAEEVVNLVKKINAELGITIIVIDHRIDKWFEAANKIAIMERGELIFYGDKMKYYYGDNKEIEEFLPTIFKVSKALNFHEPPKSFRDLRLQINNSSFTGGSNNLQDTNIYNEQNEDIVKIKKFSCSYDKVEAVKSVNLTIKKGSFNCILGHNGAGKSTFLKALMGLIKYTGSIELAGNEIKKLKPYDIAKKIGYVSQNPNDYISKDTVYEELKFTLDNYGIKDEEKIEKTLKLLDLYKLKDRNPRDISGGEKQRTAIASILVLEPEIILLDEPTRGLNIGLKKNLGKLLKKLQEKNITIILVTHDIEFAAEFSDNFILMCNGEVTAKGNINEVLGNGIYYTTSVNKLFRDSIENIFLLDEIKEKVKWHEENSSSS